MPEQKQSLLLRLARPQARRRASNSLHGLFVSLRHPIVSRPSENVVEAPRPDGGARDGDEAIVLATFRASRRDIERVERRLQRARDVVSRVERLDDVFRGELREE